MSNAVNDKQRAKQHHTNDSHKHDVIKHGDRTHELILKQTNEKHAKITHDKNMSQSGLPTGQDSKLIKQVKDDYSGRKQKTEIEHTQKHKLEKSISNDARHNVSPRGKVTRAFSEEAASFPTKQNQKVEHSEDIRKENKVPYTKNANSTTFHKSNVTRSELSPRSKGLLPHNKPYGVADNSNKETAHPHVVGRKVEQGVQNRTRRKSEGASPTRYSDNRPHIAREDTELDLLHDKNHNTGQSVSRGSFQSTSRVTSRRYSEGNVHQPMHSLGHHTRRDSYQHGHHGNEYVHNASDVLGRNIPVEDWAVPQRSPRAIRRDLDLVGNEGLHYHEPANDYFTDYNYSSTESRGYEEQSQKPYTVQTCYMHVEKGAERKESWITGCAVLSRDLVIVSDYNNNRVKILDVKNSFVLSRIVLQTSPKDLSLVSTELVAVTLPAIDTVQFITLEGYPPVLDIVSRSFKVNGYCNGIAYNDDKFFVSFVSPAKVDILSFEGEVLQTLSTDQHGLPLFKNPQYIVVYHGMLYVSDSHTNSVIKMSPSGHVINTYQNEALGNPQGLTVNEEGNIFVCGQDTHNIHVMSSDCRKLSICLDKNDGISWPHVIGYCRTSNTVYISSTSGDPDVDNYLKVYTFLDKHQQSFSPLKLVY